ncbi:MAG: formate/nitrite transporter family protein [Anaerolineae bacterium]|nr:formate/nitrite transporter family protein [Anaerolineae bacterium]NUQ03877.1 formate/nitrite transporter family protein [Anaerolineae bacterium]
MNEPPIRIDALLPSETAERAAAVGVKKAGLSLVNTLVLAVLAGGFVSVGALFATVSTAGASGMLPYGVIRAIYGLTFCLGLILVIVAGAELFTGNALITMAWASRKVTTRALLRNWSIVYAGNLVGSLVTAGLVFLSGEYRFGGGQIGQAMLNTALHKVELEPLQAVALGILCNALVCIAVWLTLGAHSTTDKILAILFPVAAFAAAGFEHSIANMYFIPIGLLIRQFDPVFAAATELDLTPLTVGGFLKNLIPVTIGNIIGGVVMVAGVYWFVYLRERR